MKTTHRSLTLGLALLALGAAGGPVQGAEVLTPCFLKLSIYEGIEGALVNDLFFDPNYPDNPGRIEYLRAFDTRDALPTDTLDNYGGRIEGYLTPQETGNYTFFLSSDDGGELWLSNTDSESGIALIAWEDDCCDPFQEPEAGDPTTSLPQPLVAGQRYYVQLLYKESAGGDYARVAWRKDGDATPAAALQPIPGAFLSCDADNSHNPSVSITTDPQNIAGEENTEVSVSVAATTTPADPMCIQWQRNGVNIPGANGDTYTFKLTKADQGARYRALVAVPGASATSAEAQVTSVTNDTTPPTVLGARGVPRQPQVVVTFSEALNPASATATGNYAISGGGGLTVSDASLSADGTRVTLTTGAQTVGTEYTITINNVADAAAAPNPVAPGTQVSFFALGAWLQGEDGFVVFEAEDYDRNLDGLWELNTARGPASGDASMLIPNGVADSETGTKLEYDIVFTKTGTHIVWYRAGADAGEDDSGWLHLDGERPPNRVTGNEASMSGFNGAIFEWNSTPQDGAAPFTIEIETTGLHTIGLASREDGAFFDKFVITTDPNFNPDSFGPLGPPVTLREGEPPPTGAAIEFTQQPVDASGIEGQPLVVDAAVSVSPDGSLYTIQWQRKEGANFTDIVGQTLPSLTLDPVTLDWNGAVVRMRVIALGMTAYSDEANLTVTTEDTPPEVLKASGIAATRRVTVQFSEPLAAASAQNPANYAISGSAGSVAVTGATLLANETTVILDTGAQTVGTKYTVTVNGVTDQAASPNPVVNGQARYYALGDLLPQGADGLIVFEAESYSLNTDGLWIEDSQRGTPSGGLAMVLPNGAGGSETASKLLYDLTFTQTGTHIIWYRAGGDSGNDDSSWLHLDGDRPVERATGNLASMSGFNGAIWVWTSDPQDGDSPMTFEIASPGLHTLGLARREDGAFFDKFVITTDPDFDPEAFGPLGPPETRSGAPALPALAISSPADGSAFPAGSNLAFAVDISATSRVISRVEYLAGGEVIGETTTAPFDFTWENVPTGGYVLTARLTDDVGDSVRSAPVLVKVGEPREILFLVGTADLSAAPGDAAVRDHLASFGFDVVVVEDINSQPNDAFAKLLIVDSSTVDSGSIADQFREAAVPLLSWEEANQDDFGMTGDVVDVDRGNVGDQTMVQIVNADHPLAAGLPAGSVTVTTSPLGFAFGKPGPNATVVATVPGVPEQAVIYGYETGAEMMDGFIAPARRVQIFLSDLAFPALNPDGMALFDAALSWALNEPLTPGEDLQVSASLDGGNLVLSWQGGVGPFTVESKNALTDPAWGTVTTTDENTASVAITGGAGFFRIRGQ